MDNGQNNSVGHIESNKEVDGLENKSESNISSNQALPTATAETEAANEYDSALNAALQGMVKKTEKPMNEFHHRVYKYMVDIDQQLDQLTTENAQLKGEREMVSKSLTELERKILNLERDRDTWKAKAESLKRSLDKSKTGTDDQHSIVMTLKRERDKLKLEMIEVTKTMKNRDSKQKELEEELNKLRKAHEERAHELRVNDTSKQQMSEKISMLESRIQNEEANRAELVAQLNALKNEKKDLDKRVEAQMADTARAVAEKDALQEEIGALKNKVHGYTEILDKIMEEELTFRASTSLLNQLISEKDAEMRSINYEGEVIRPNLTLSSPAAMEACLEGLMRKRKISADVYVQTGDDDATGGKKTKPVVATEDGETEEEGEIVDQQPQQETPRVPVTSTSPRCPSAVKSSQRGPMWEGKSYKNHMPVKNNYRIYPRHDSNGKFGRGKRLGNGK